MSTSRKSTLQQTLDVDLNSLKADVDARAFSCDVTGRYAVLGDSGGLLLVDLEYPYQRPRIFHHQSKSGVDCLRWNPHVSHQDHVASTSQASVLVWRVDNDYRPLMAGLRKHIGPVNDLAWAPDLPHILATAGEDGAIHLWDVRSHQSPCQSFSAGANRPAHLLAWNKLSPNALASAHDHEVWLWDTRKGPPSSSLSSSCEYFATGSSTNSNSDNNNNNIDCSIQSLQWNPTREKELVVSGKDGAVTFWELTNLTEWSSSQSRTSSSVSVGSLSLDIRETVELYVPEEQPKLVHWTPFGTSGMVSVGKLKSSLSSASSSSSLSSLATPRLDTLYLWSFPPPPSSSGKTRAPEALQLVQRFEGHKAPILAVDWRVVDGLVFQIVSLDAVGHMRLWRVEPWMLRACGHATAPTARAEAAAAAAAAASSVSSTNQNKEMSSSLKSSQTSNRVLSQSMAAKLTLDALKIDIVHPVPGLGALSTHTPAVVPPRPSSLTSTHAAASVWQEMIEVEDMARRGELTDVDIEMIDSMARTMRLSLGPVQIRPPEAGVGVGERGGRGGARSTPSVSPSASASASASSSVRLALPPRSPSPRLGEGGGEGAAAATGTGLKGKHPLTPGRGGAKSMTSTSSSPGPEGSEREEEGEGEGEEEEEGESIRLLVTVRFPPAYPFGAMPLFHFRAVRDLEDEDGEDEDEEDEENDKEEEDEDLEGGTQDSASSRKYRKKKKGSRKSLNEEEEDEEDDSRSGDGEEDEDHEEDVDETFSMEGDDGAKSKTDRSHRRGGSSQGEHRCSSSASGGIGSGLLSQVGRDMLSREVEDVARLALEAQRPCLELCIRHLQKTLLEAAEAGLLLTAGVIAGTTAGGDDTTTPKKTALGADGSQLPSSSSLSPSSMIQGTGASKALMSKVQRDQLLPCPRYSGAVFTGQGVLLCFNCQLASRAQSQGPAKKPEGGSKKKAAAASAAAAAKQQKPPRTYAALLQRHRTAPGMIRKGFLSTAETPPPRGGGGGGGGGGGRGGMSRVGVEGRTLFYGGEGAMDLRSSGYRGSSLFMEFPEEDEGEDDEEEEEEARINNDDDDEDGDDDWSSEEEEEEEDEAGEMSASATALYASYFQSPQSRLPINHPDHEYSFHFQDDPSLDELGLSAGGRGGMAALVAAAAVPAFTTQVTLVDFSHTLPGSSILAAALRLGPSEDDKMTTYGNGTVIICFEPPSPPPSRPGSEKGSPALHRSPVSMKQGGLASKRRGASELQLSLLGRGISAGNTPASPRLQQQLGSRSPSSHLRRQAALAQAHAEESHGNHPYHHHHHQSQHHVSFATEGRSPSTPTSHGLRRLASEAELRSAMKTSLVRGQTTGTRGTNVQSSSLSASKVALRRHNSLYQERGLSAASSSSSSAATSTSASSSSSSAAVSSSSSSAPASASSQQPAPSHAHLHRLHYHTIGAPSTHTHHQGSGRDATAPLSRVRKLAGAMKREGSFLTALSLLSGGGEAAAGEHGPRSPSGFMVGSPTLPTRSMSGGSVGGDGDHHHHHHHPQQQYYLGTSPAGASSALLATSPAGRSFLMPPLRPSITVGSSSSADGVGVGGAGAGAGAGGGGGAALTMAMASSSAASFSTGGAHAHAHHHHHHHYASFSPSSPWGPLARQITEAREISELCRVNAEVMDRYGGANRAELVKLWSMLFVSTSACLDALCAEATRLVKGNHSRAAGGPGQQQNQQQQQQHQVVVTASAERLRPWAEGPLGRPLVEKLLDLYEKEGDVQTLATIICVLDVNHPYTLLRASKRKKYDGYLREYAELLYRWGALETRTEVLKRLSSSSSFSQGAGAGAKAKAEREKQKEHGGAGKQHEDDMMVVAIRCQACGAEDDQIERGKGICRQCKVFAFRCVVCQLAVKGQSMFCLNCSHGGHTPHVYEWFRDNDVCPSGCGCRCVFSQSYDITEPEARMDQQQQQPQQQQHVGGAIAAAAAAAGGGGGRMWG